MLNNSQRRKVSLDLSFLPAGQYQLTYWKDGKKADKQYKDLEHKSVKFNAQKPLVIDLAGSGGYVAIIK